MRVLLSIKNEPTLPMPLASRYALYFTSYAIRFTFQLTQDKSLDYLRSSGR
jgi:hypothetical protein